MSLGRVCRVSPSGACPLPPRSFPPSPSFLPPSPFPPLRFPVMTPPPSDGARCAVATCGDWQLLPVRCGACNALHCTAHAAPHAHACAAAAAAAAAYDAIACPACGVALLPPSARTDDGVGWGGVPTRSLPPTSTRAAHRGDVPPPPPLPLPVRPAVVAGAAAAAAIAAAAAEAAACLRRPPPTPAVGGAAARFALPWRWRVAGVAATFASPTGSRWTTGVTGGAGQPGARPPLRPPPRRAAPRRLRRRERCGHTGRRRRPH